MLLLTALCVAVASIPALAQQRPSVAAERQHNPASTHGRPQNLLPDISVPKIKVDSHAFQEKPQYQGADHAQESGIKWTDAVIAVFTVVLGLCAIAGGFISYFQWDALKKQDARLKESIDKAEASSTQQSIDMQASIAAAKDAAKVAEKTLVAQDRPWISIQPHIVGPLIFTDTRISIKVSVTLRNIGRSPAADVQPFSDMYPSLVKASRAANEFIQERLYRSLAFGSTLFPNTEINHPFDGGWDEFMPTQVFKDTIIDDEKGRMEQHPNGKPWTLQNPTILFRAVYGIPADQGPQRQTIMCFEIAHKAPGHMGWDGSPCEIPAEDLILRHYFGGKTT